MPTLLLVDDEPYVRYVVRGMLRGMGYVVREAVNGRKALEAVTVARPDLVILNIVMPEMNGLTVLDRFRALGLVEELPVLVITGSLTPDHVILEKGARGVLRKPFRTRTLRSAVRIMARGGTLNTQWMLLMTLLSGFGEALSLS